MMSNTEMSNNEKVKLDKATLKKVMWREILTLQWSWNYERMQALGFMWSILPALRKIYANDDEFKEAMKRHMVFYNTNPTFGPLITGAAVALEEDRAGKAASSIKVGIMGPIAGIGDTIQAVLFRPIMAVLAASLAMNGNIAGALLMFLAGLAWMSVKIPLFWLGYNKSTGVISEVTGDNLLDRVTNIATMAGLVVIGGFIPSILSKLTTPLEFVRKVVVEGEEVEKVIKIQEVLNGILPYLIPTLVVGLGYYLIKNRKLSPVKVLLIIVALAFITKIIGIM